MPAERARLLIRCKPDGSVGVSIDVSSAQVRKRLEKILRSPMPDYSRAMTVRQLADLGLSWLTRPTEVIACSVYTASHRQTRPHVPV
jgi:hypothetical protein